MTTGYGRTALLPLLAHNCRLPCLRAADPYVGSAPVGPAVEKAAVQPEVDWSATDCLIAATPSTRRDRQLRPRCCQWGVALCYGPTQLPVARTPERPAGGLGGKRALH